METHIWDNWQLMIPIYGLKRFLRLLNHFWRFIVFVDCLIIYSRLTLFFYEFQISAVFFDVLGDQFDLVFGFVLFSFLELGIDELKPIFDGVFSSSLQNFDESTPLFFSIIFEDVRKEQEILF